MTMSTLEQRDYPNGSSRPYGCEFCAELQSDPAARYYSMYGRGRSRVVLESLHYDVIPTLGQLFRGSVLIIPRVHIETLATAPPHLLSDLRAVIAACRHRLRELGDVLVYEHGAKPATGGSCGIYHAHAHVLPLPSAIEAKVLLSEGHHCNQDFTGTLNELRDADEYLLVEDSSANTRVVTIDDENRSRYGSQYFRRRLAALFGLKRDWDWRAYAEPEADLIFTIDWFRQPAQFSA